MAVEYLAILAAASCSVVLAAFLVRLRVTAGRLRSTADGMREYAQKTSVIRHQTLDVIMLGPRFAGKTALSRHWGMQPWREVLTTAPTDYFATTNIVLFEGESNRERDAVFDVSREVIPQFRLRVTEYAGDVKLLYTAINELPSLSHVALVFVLPCFQGGAFDAPAAVDIENAFAANDEFLGAEFLARLANVTGFRDRVRKVFVVFNKIDVLPNDQQVDGRYVTLLQDAHSDLIERLEAWLGRDKLAFEYISVKDDFGTGLLLRALAEITFNLRRSRGEPPVAVPVSVEERIDAPGAPPYGIDVDAGGAGGRGGGAS